ncbi:MAG: hypothetical protein C0501_31495 [Isosphaera sp.]|nr:hypothetical protein [Isosphaera sp.]
MSRPRIFAGLLLASVSAASSAAPAPAPKPDEPVPAAAARLLKYRKVQKELKMSAEQRIAIVDGLEDVEEAFEKALDVLDKMPNAPDEAFDKLEKERAKGVAKVLADAAAKGLTPAQRSRLRQIDRRLRGPAAFADPAVQTALGLTDAQKKAAADLAEKATAHAERYLDTLGNDNHEAVKKEVLAFRADGAKGFVAALTADQQATWKAMLGDPVTGFDPDELWFAVFSDEDAEPAPDK